MSVSERDRALFEHGYVRGEGATQDDWMATVIGMAELLGVSVSGHVERLGLEQMRLASEILGRDVPEPFYRGFPSSVRRLGREQMAIDQLLNYAVTYGAGVFDQDMHSVMEDVTIDQYRRLLPTNMETKAIRVLTPEEADAKTREWVGMTLSSTRPASEGELRLVIEVLADSRDEMADDIACRENRVRLAAKTRDPRVIDKLRPSDVLPLTELIQSECDTSRFLWATSKTSLRKLNLPNKERKFLTGVIHKAFQRDMTRPELSVLFENRRKWKGLLHHIHFKVEAKCERTLLDALYAKPNLSDMSTFEQLLDAGCVREAAAFLAETKGQGALLRHLDHILSRTRTQGEVEDVLATVGCQNKAQLIQMLRHLDTISPADAPRTFRFIRNGTGRAHKETSDEVSRRRTNLSPETRAKAKSVMSQRLYQACHGTLGKVYVDDTMKGIAIELNASASNSGVATLPSGSRVPIEDMGKTIRVFTYWERTDDVDLSLIGVQSDGSTIEFSWRSWASRDVMAWSGDKTDGYDGASEYFDVDMPKLMRKYPDMRYLIACDNVYSGTPFDECDVHAGYMLRERPKDGMVFDPKTVKSTFRITGNSTFAYLFAIDLAGEQLIWLNVSSAEARAVAGNSQHDLIRNYLRYTETLDMYMLAGMLSTQCTRDPSQADVIFTRTPEAYEGLQAETITPQDGERIRQLMD